MFKTIKSRLIGTSVVIVVLAIAVATLVSYQLAKSFILDDINVALGETAQSQSSRIALWVQSQKNIVVSLTPAAKLADPIPALQQALQAGKLDIVYIGHADKRIFSVPTRVRPSEFDPTARPWYKLAQTSDKPVITAPYISAATKKLVVTFANAIKEGTETVAGIGSDVTLDDVLFDLQKIKPTPSGFAFLIDRSGNIIAHPKTELTLKPIADLTKDITKEAIEQATRLDAQPIVAKIGESNFLLKAAPVADTDWILLTAANQAEALERLDQLLTSAAIALIVVGFAAAAIATVSVNKQLSGLTRVRDAMLEIGSGTGDLTKRLTIYGQGELSEIAGAFNTFVDKIEHVMRDVRLSSESIANASREIATGTLDLSNRTEQTASNLEETAASMEGLTDAVRKSADSAAMANQLAENSAQIANRGGDVVSQVVATMTDISASSSRIADIIGTIDGIAFQTNILALNAAVEAARAGEQGRGFAVVASEVRSLAGRSAAAAKEIKELIGSSVERVHAGTKLVAQAGQTMGEIVGSIEKVSAIVGDISTGAVTQRRGIDEINAAISSLDQMTQQNAALVEQSTAAADSMREQAAELARVVSTFRISSHQLMG